jgi:tetratricopeptide (TPR) repeat protein
MTRLPLRLLPVAALLLSASCAYYNGLYNAKALARQAERAERQGKTLEAQGLWGQVAVKAETVLVRHPTSKWTEEARFLRGKALERGGDCSAALIPLAQLVREARDPYIADEAALLLSGCQAQLGDVEAAGFAVERLIDSPDPARRAEARWRTGVAYRRSGRAGEAIPLLRSSGHPAARGELAAALAAAGRPAEAVALADSLIIERGPATPWGAILEAIGRSDVDAASALTDRVLAQGGPFPPDTAATWLTLDGRRLLPSNEARGTARFEAAYRAAPARAVGVEALLAVMQADLERADGPGIFDSIPARLGEVEPSAGEAEVKARQLVASAATLKGRLDSLVVTAPQGDLRGFLLGEALRDSLHAPRLAARLWRRVLNERPDTPYAPKLLLAIAAVEVSVRDSIAAVLQTRYPESPYLLALHGTEVPGFRVLEDSLRGYAQSLRSAPAGRRPPRATRPAPAAPTPATPVQ